LYKALNQHVHFYPPKKKSFALFFFSFFFILNRFLLLYFVHTVPRFLFAYDECGKFPKTVHVEFGTSYIILATAAAAFYPKAFSRRSL